MLTEVLLTVTNQEILSIAKEVYDEFIKGECYCVWRLVSAGLIRM